jgi:glycosyltransferase involved in cell wall biosynthesis
MLITVFTPAYNRGNLLLDLYQSLVAQSCHDFEWIVVDDGSTDHTMDVLHKLEARQDHPFEMRYFHKSNGGKHTAINRGLREAKGELFFIVDSDDILPSNALETLGKYYGQIKDDNCFVGVCGLIAHRDGTAVSLGVQTVIDAMTVEMMYKYKTKGDLAEAYKTSMMQQCPFPEIPGEHFCPEVLEWNRLTRNRKVRFFPDTIYYRDYLEGGLTDNIVRIRMQSPVTSMMTYQELTLRKIPFIYKLRNAINYWRFRYCYDPKHSSVVPSELPLLKSWMNIVRPLGWLMHLRDKRTVYGK